MSYQTIRDLLRVQLNTTPGNLPTAWENVAYTPVVGDPYQSVHLLPARTENPTFDRPFRRETGLMQVSLFFPVNAGPDPAALRAQAIASMFPRGLTLVNGTLRVLIDASPFIGPARNEGAWYFLPVSIPYTADVYSD
jgi:hypothetical protein